MIVCVWLLSIGPEGLSLLRLDGLSHNTRDSVMERQPRIRLWSSYAGVLATVFSFGLADERIKFCTFGIFHHERCVPSLS